MPQARIVAAIKTIMEIIIADAWIAVVVILVIVLIAAVIMVFVGEDGTGLSLIPTRSWPAALS